MSDAAIGFWFDHSKPLVSGWILTLPLDKANILLSALTLLVTIAGSSLWSIVALILHSAVISTRRRPDAVDLQHQVALCNSSGGLGTLMDSIKIHRAWSKVNTRDLWGKTLSLALPSLVIWLGFSAASIFTSKVAQGGADSIIVRSNVRSCGLFGQPDPSDITQRAAYSEKYINDTIQARNYALNFYMDAFSTRSGRSIFPQPNIPVEVTVDVECPVTNQTRCRIPAGSTVRMETAFLNSQAALGINAGEEDQVSIKLQTTCAMIDVGDYITENTTGSYVDFNLGSFGGATPTYRYYRGAFQDNVGYQLVTIMALAQDNPQSTNWHPVDDLARSDAETSMFFMNQNSIRYLEPVKDPFFSAERLANFSYNGIDFYNANYGVNTMYCADQYVLCNPAKDKCSAPGGVIGTSFAAADLEYNDAQSATTARILSSIGTIGTWSGALALGANALFASAHIYQGLFSTGLPDNQWQIEVLGWFQTNVAKFQASIAEYAYKNDLNAAITVSSPYNMQPNETVGPTAGMIDELERQCSNQLIRSTGEVQNFDVVGVLIIVCASVVITMISYITPAVLKFIGRRHHYWKSESERARQADEKLHLLRLALDASAVQAGARWEAGAWDVPVLREPVVFDRPIAQDDLTSYHSVGQAGGMRVVSPGSEGGEYFQKMQGNHGVSPISSPGRW